MDFGGDIGLWQRRIAEGLEGTARRLAVFEALAVNTGQAVLDLGCGGGHLVRDLALAVGDSGRVVGLDASTDQLGSAGEFCAGLSAVELMQADATDLPFEDASFDSLASIQMLEYVPDVDGAIAEARRVLKPGGKAVLVSVLWDHWRFHGADPELNDRMHDIWRSHCTHQMLPMELPGKLIAAGFNGVAQKPIAFINGTMHENAFALWATKLVAAFAIAKGVRDEDAADWIDQLEKADAEGRFGFVSVPVLTTATADSTSS
ncbi:MAG: methyltransferase domain-containing protein [Gammaproteobacteria bacterium]|nr:methyltransferase domain-containing protein [Gammaproteobacteria bacterium]